MIAALVFSHDHKLIALLGPALGPDFRIVAESDEAAVWSRLATEPPAVLILDPNPEWAAQGDLFRRLYEHTPSSVPIVVMTDDDRRSAAMQWLRQGAYDFCRKPPSIPELRVVISRACEHSALKREVQRVRTVRQEMPGCDGMVGASPGLREVFGLIQRVANLDAFVLITGESGTGKELVARAIHNLSDRREGPFVAVACGAIPETLIESELFGHEKGAFTGTTGARIGYIEQAAQGTLLLDEIGELSLSTQVKLLRVLQEREFSRLGNNRVLPLRARVVFATHRKLEQMVGQGTFRQDLFFRVSVLNIRVPALRDRPEDIPLLANHFLRKYSAAFGKPVQEIHPRAMRLLLEHDWPGNVRELENAIQTAIILCSEEFIQPQDFSSLCGMDEEPEEGEGGDEGELGGCESFDRQMREYKIRLAKKELAECMGNKTKAARNLNISRAYLYRLIRCG